MRRQARARELEHALAPLRRGHLDADDVERVAGLVAQHGPAAVPVGGQALEGPEPLEVAQGEQGGLLELRDHAGLERPMDLESARGRELVERQEALEQLTEVD